MVGAAMFTEPAVIADLNKLHHADQQVRWEFIDSTRDKIKTALKDAFQKQMEQESEAYGDGRSFIRLGDGQSRDPADPIHRDWSVPASIHKDHVRDLAWLINTGRDEDDMLFKDLMYDDMEPEGAGDTDRSGDDSEATTGQDDDSEATTAQEDDSEATTEQDDDNDDDYSGA